MDVKIRTRTLTHFSHTFVDQDGIADIWVVGEINNNEEEAGIIVDVVLVRQKGKADWLDCTKTILENKDYFGKLMEKIVEWADEDVLCFIDEKTQC